MYSRMNEVAALLGVRIGERFKIDAQEGEFIFDNNGLYSFRAHDWCPDVLCQLISGNLNVAHKSGKPSYDSRYYSVGPGGVLEPGTWLNDFIDVAMYKLGNCYRTIEEAEANRDKWVAFYASDEMLEV